VRVVLDTNILVSGLMSLTSPPARILDAVRTGQIVAVTPEAFLADLRLHADLTIPVPTDIPIRDERDRPFLDLLTTIPSPHYFVTGYRDFDATHYSRVPVISATEFAGLL
jgi:hypothetical protein